MPREYAWDDPRQIERCLDMLYGFRDEIIAISRKIITLQRQQLRGFARQAELDADAPFMGGPGNIPEAQYIRESRDTHQNYLTYKDEINELYDEVPRWEANMHDMLDLCERHGIPCHTPLYSDQTRTMIRLRAIIDKNQEEGCT